MGRGGGCEMRIRLTTDIDPDEVERDANCVKGEEFHVIRVDQEQNVFVRYGDSGSVWIWAGEYVVVGGA